MNNLERAFHYCELALSEQLTANGLSVVLSLKEAIAKAETAIAGNATRQELTSLGMTKRSARAAIRRAGHTWRAGLGVEHQDEILSALEKLSTASTRREEIYSQAAEAALHTSLSQIRRFTRALVRAENERLAGDPFVVCGLRAFRMHAPDEHGGCRVTGYLPPPVAALLKAQFDDAFSQTAGSGDDLRTIDQRTHDAFAETIKKADSARTDDRGHCALVVSVTEDDAIAVEAKFGTNVGIDLNLFDLDYLGGDKIIDYVAIHAHTGAVKQLVTATRSANFHQRVALLAEQAVCQHLGCDEPASRCDAHHVQSWSRGGPTSLNNFALLCRSHHRQVDDTWHGSHLRKHQGLTTWISRDGTQHRNISPAAQRAPGRQYRRPQHPPNPIQT